MTAKSWFVSCAFCGRTVEQQTQGACDSWYTHHVTECRKRYLSERLQTELLREKGRLAKGHPTDDWRDR